MILVPRPAPHLPRTLQALQTAGLTQITPLELSYPESLPIFLPADATAFILTSTFAAQIGLPSLPIYCVGDATAHAARSHGLNVAFPGTNNGLTLAEDIAALHLPPQHFIHLHGDHAHMSWHNLIQQAGHRITPILAYRNHYREALSEPLPAADITLLFSAGSASHLAKLMKHANMQPSGTAIALSPAVATAAKAFWPEVVTAAQPNLQAMIETIRHLKG